MPLTDLGSLPPALAAPLKTYNSLEGRHGAARRSLPSIGSMTLLLAAAAGLDALTPLSQTSRVFLSVMVWSLLSLALFWSLHPMLRRREALAAARALEARIGTMHEALISAVQFAQDASQSGWMVRRTIAIAVHHVQGVDLVQLFAGKRSKRFVAASLLVLAGFFGLLWQSTTARQHVLRVLFPSESLLRPSVVELRIDPDHDLSISKGQALFIAVQAQPDPGEVSFEIADETTTRILTLDRSAPGLYRAGWNAVQSSFRFRASAGDARSAWYRVDVEAPPSIENLTLTITPPATTRRAAWTIPAADASIPKGSTIALSGSFAGTFAKQVLLMGEDGSSIPLEIKEKKVGGAFSPQATGLWSLQLTDAKGQVHDNMPKWRITLVGDAAPTVTLTGPGLQGAVFGAKETLSLTLSAQDDLALDWVRLDLGLPDGRTERTAIPAKGVKAEGLTLLDLGRWKLSPGETITLEALAQDSAGQQGRSARTRILIGSETPSIPSHLLEALQQLREKTRFIAGHLQAAQTAWSEIRNRRRSGLDATLEDESQRERQRLKRIFAAIVEAQEQTRSLLFTANTPVLAELRPLFRRLELDVTIVEHTALDAPKQDSVLDDLQKALEAAVAVQKDLSRHVGLLTLWADLGLWKTRSESLGQRRSRLIPLFRAALHFDPALLETSKQSHKELVRILSQTAGGDAGSLEGKLLPLYSFLYDFSGSVKQRLSTMHDDEIATVRREMTSSLQRTNASEELLRSNLPLIRKNHQALEHCENAAQAIAAGINASYQLVERTLASQVKSGNHDNLIPTLKTEAQTLVQDLLRRNPLRDPTWNNSRNALEHTLSRLSTELHRQESLAQRQVQAPESGALERVLASETQASLKAFRKKLEAERTRLDPLEAPNFQTALKALDPTLKQLEQGEKLNEDLHRAQAGALARKAQGLIAELSNDTDPGLREKAAKELIPLLQKTAEAAAAGRYPNEAKILAEAQISSAAPENLKPRDIIQSLESLSAQERRQLELNTSIANNLEARKRVLESDPLLAKAILESLPQRMQLRAECLDQQGKEDHSQAQRSLAQKTASMPSNEDPVKALARIQAKQAALEKEATKPALPQQHQDLAKTAAASLAGDRAAQQDLTQQLRNIGSTTATQPRIAANLAQTKAQAQETLELLAALDVAHQRSQALATELGTQIERLPVGSASQAALQKQIAQELPKTVPESSSQAPLLALGIPASASTGHLSARRLAAAALAKQAIESSRSASQALLQPQAQSLAALAQRLATLAESPTAIPAPLSSPSASLARLSENAEHLAQELRRDLLAPALEAALQSGQDQALKQAQELAANLAAVQQAAKAVQSAQEEERRIARRLADLENTSSSAPSPSATAAAIEHLARQQDNAEKILSQAKQQSEEAAKSEAQATQDEKKQTEVRENAKKEAEEATAATERVQADASPKNQQAQAAAQKRAAEAAKRAEQAQTQAQRSRANATQREIHAQQARSAALLGQNAVLEAMAPLAERVEHAPLARDQQRLADLAERAAQTAEALADMVPAPSTATQAMTIAQAYESQAKANAIEDALLTPLLAAVQSFESALSATSQQETIPQPPNAPLGTELPASVMAAAQAAMAQQQSNQAAQLISMASLDQAMMPSATAQTASNTTNSSQAAASAASNAQATDSSAQTATTQAASSSQTPTNSSGSSGNSGNPGKHQDGAIDTTPSAKGSEQSDWSRLKASMENAVRQSSEERFGEEDQAAIRAYFTRLSQEGQ